jgi:hypothetical protein
MEIGNNIALIGTACDVFANSKKRNRIVEWTIKATA